MEDFLYELYKYLGYSEERINEIIKNREKHKEERFKLLYKEYIDNEYKQTQEYKDKCKNLKDITSHIIEFIRNDDNKSADAIDIITSLHNELYKEITGEYYDYMWHWTNKQGYMCNDELYKKR